MEKFGDEGLLKVPATLELFDDLPPTSPFRNSVLGRLAHQVLTGEEKFKVEQGGAKGADVKMVSSPILDLEDFLKYHKQPNTHGSKGFALLLGEHFSRRPRIWTIVGDVWKEYACHNPLEHQQEWKTLDLGWVNGTNPTSQKGLDHFIALEFQPHSDGSDDEESETDGEEEKREKQEAKEREREEKTKEKKEKNQQQHEEGGEVVTQGDSQMEDPTHLEKVFGFELEDAKGTTILCRGRSNDVPSAAIECVANCLLQVQAKLLKGNCTTLDEPWEELTFEAKRDNLHNYIHNYVANWEKDNCASEKLEAMTRGRAIISHCAKIFQISYTFTAPNAENQQIRDTIVWATGRGRKSSRSAGELYNPPKLMELVQEGDTFIYTVQSNLQI